MTCHCTSLVLAALADFPSSFFLAGRWMLIATDRTDSGKILFLFV